MTTKQQLFDFCNSFIINRINRIQSNIDGIQESFASETKSSAGDKHETGRAMLQLEREKLGQQLAEAERVEQILKQVPLQAKTLNIGLGSLVTTSKACYFLAISAGEYKGAERSIFCISMQTPIALLLLGKTKGDKVTFNGEEIKIFEIV